MILIFLPCREKAHMITKNSVVKIQNLVNHESQPIKSNPVSKAFDRVGHAGLPHQFKSYRISGLVFGLTSSFLSKRQLWVVLDGKALEDSILGPTLVIH